MSFLSEWRPASWLRVVLTLLLALSAALLCVWWRTPIPWMIGPLLATALVSVMGGRTESWTPLRNGGQCAIGAALGLYFTPAVGALVVGLWWSIALGVAWALLLGMACGAWLRRVHAVHLTHLTPAQLNGTTYFAGAIGGASEMTLMAERRGARTDLVAAAHSLRVLLVTVTIPFALQCWGVTGLETFTPGSRDVLMPGFMALMALCALSAWAMDRLGRTNPWFMGALVVTMVITLCGVSLSAIPQAVSTRRSW